MKKHFRNILLLSLMSSLLACATLDYESPATVNLSGRWIIDSALSQGVIFPLNKPERRGQKRGERAGGPPPGGGRGGQSRPDESEESALNQGHGQRSDKPDSATATEMTIEHSGNSMGILYQSGNYRDVDWGVNETRRRTVTAGWKKEALVIKTKGRRDTITETYQLLENGQILTVQFEISGEQYKRVYRLEPAKQSALDPKP